MKKITSVILLTAVFLLTLSTAVYAQAAIPVGQCPVGFEPHNFMDHDMPEHQHAGLKVDLNQDGTICVRHVTEQIHAHIDNVVR